MKSTMTSSIQILIVDNRAGNLAVLESVLSAPSSQLVTVQNAQDALLAELDTDIAATLLDVKMPDLNGYQLTRILQMTAEPSSRIDPHERASEQ